MDKKGMRLWNQVFDGGYGLSESQANRLIRLGLVDKFMNIMDKLLEKRLYECTN